MASRRESGWWRTYYTEIPVDSDGDPIPWFTYPSISFLQGRLNRELDVFEFGSGNSTLWWCSRVSRVVACEHDSRWHARMTELAPDNLELLQVDADTDGEYCRSSVRSGRLFDVISVDGRDRVNCALQSLHALKPDGVLIWDDSQRARYADGLAQVESAGFRRIDFVGLRPVSQNLSSTTVFYRPDNCLGI